LKGIESDIREIKDGQKLFMECMRNHENNIARYPTPEEVQEADRKLRLHETYFKIIWVALGGAWSILLIAIGLYLKNVL
jgi:hypothetical protein